MIMISAFMAATLLFAGGAGQMPNELLAVIPADAYWKHEGIDPTSEKLMAMLEDPAPPKDVDALLGQLGDESFRKRKAAQDKLMRAGPAILPKVRPLLTHPDAEVAARAKDIIESLTAGTARQRVHRLMAIRTLGERKEAGAKQALRKLQASKEPFVAEYVERALARIEGKDYSRGELPAGLTEADVARLPGGLGLIAQLDLTPGRRVIGLEEMIKGLEQGLNNNEVGMDRAVGALTGIVHQVGNVRVDAVTLGVAEDVGDDAGFMVMYFRGLYDPELMIAALKRSEADAELRVISGRQVLHLKGEDTLFWAVSRNLLVQVSGASAEKMPTEKVIKLVEGKAKARRGEKLAALLEGCDTDQPFWAVARMTESYRKAGGLLASVESLTLEAGPAEKGTRVTLTGSAQDADSAGRALEALDGHLAQTRELATSMVGAMPGLKFLPDLIGAVKTAREAGTIKADVLVSDEETKKLLMLPLMLFSGRSGEAG